MINCRSEEEYTSLKATIDKMLKDKNLFIDETEQVNFKKLFQAEWEDTLKNGQATLYLS